MPFYYDDERPWLRRRLDGMASHLYWRTSLGARGVFMATLRNIVLGPIILVVDWWERMRRTPLAVSGANLAMGFPAVAGMLAAWAIGSAAASVEPEEIVSNHQQRANAARLAKDHATELLALRRMRELDPTPQATIELATALAAAGEAGKALALMRELTPPDEVGSPVAHRWFARRYCDDYAYPKAGDHARLHLERALQASNQSPRDEAETLVMLGKLEMREGRLDRAAEAFERAIELKNPAGALEMGWLRLQEGRVKDARDLAARALRYYEERVRLQSDDLSSRALQVQAVALSGDVFGGIRALEPLVAEVRAPEARQAVAEACLRIGKCTSSPPERWRIWDMAFRLDPSDASVLQHLVAAVARNPREWQYFDNALQAARGDDAAAAPAELLLGLSALNRGNVAAAGNHLRRAAELDPGAPRVMAALARRAALTPGAMLGWADLGLSAWPAEPELRYVRGLAQYAAGNVRESAADLAAVQALRDSDPAYHGLMADVYDALDQPARAAEHRRQANDFAPVQQGAIGNASTPR